MFTPGLSWSYAISRWMAYQPGRTLLLLRSVRFQRNWRFWCQSTIDSPRHSVVAPSTTEIVPSLHTALPYASSQRPCPVSHFMYKPHVASAPHVVGFVTSETGGFDANTFAGGRHST